jgi:hypothetical protein
MRAIATFSLRTIEQLPFIQLRQAAPNHAGRQVLVVGPFEVFDLLSNSHFRPIGEEDSITAFLSPQLGCSVIPKDSMLLSPFFSCLESCSSAFQAVLSQAKARSARNLS